MGAIISKQSLADRAANYKFHPLRKKSEKNSAHENNDRVITDCTPSAKQLDNKEGENIENDHRSPNSDKNAQNIESISPTTNTLQASKISSERNTQSISSPHESIPPTTNKVHTSEKNSDRNTRSISSPPESIFPIPTEVHTFEKNSVRSISSPHESISTTTNTVQLQTSEINSNKNPQGISSPLKSISPTTTVFTSENNLKLEQKESIPVSDSDNNTPGKKELEDDDQKGQSDYHDKSDDDYGRRISERHSDYDGWIGSPSFREYCVKDHLKPDSSTSDGEKIETKGKPIKANEDSTPVSSRKGRTSRRIKKVISMGNPSAMGKIFSVSACYSPGNAAHDKLAKPIKKNVEKTKSIP